jgi:hypothetical protein
MQLLAYRPRLCRLIDSLYETVALGATRVGFITLEDDLLKLTIGLEDLLKIRLGNAEVDVADIEAVEGRAIGTRSSTTLGGPGSTILLGFSELRNDGDTFELLAGQLKSLGNRLFVLELDVTNAGVNVSMRDAQDGEALLAL